MKKIKLIIYLILLCGFCLPAEGGVGTEVIKQGMKFLSRKVAREAAEDVSETAAKKLVREAIHHSDDVAKLAKEFGEEGLVQFAKSSTGRRLYDEVGVDAAKTILKHGSIGEELLIKAPKGSVKNVAVALSKMEKPAARRLTSAVRKGGEEALIWAGKHPGLVAFGAVGTFLLAHPTARAILDAVLDHPYASIGSILAIIVVAWFLWTIYLPVLVVRLRRRLSGGAKEDAMPQDSPSP